MPRPKKLDAGRAAVKYVGLPVELWDQLNALAEANERSIAFVARRMAKVYLEWREKNGDDELPKGDS